MQRNTLRIIIFLGIFAALVAGVNIGKMTSSKSQPATVTPTPGPRLLSHETCGISFSYPETLTKIDIETGGATLVNTKKEGDTIIVLCQEDIPRVPLTEDKIETVPIGSVSAQLYHDASQNDGTPVDKLIFTHPYLKKDVYVAGFGEIFTELVKTIKIVQ